MEKEEIRKMMDEMPDKMNGMKMVQNLALTAESDGKPILYYHSTDLADSLNALKDYCYKQANEAGWHKNPREIGTMLMLIVSEVAEAMEGSRKGLQDDHLPHRSMLEVELADALIRICDLAGREGLDLGGAVVEKLRYNLKREDHKLENRAKEGGKQF